MSADRRERPRLPLAGEPILIRGNFGDLLEVRPVMLLDGELAVEVERGTMRLLLSRGTAIALSGALIVTASGVRRHDDIAELLKLEERAA